MHQARATLRQDISLLTLYSLQLVSDTIAVATLIFFPFLCELDTNL